ncbi:acetyl-CoA synthetase [Streptomyces sp. NPDC048420]|uniref:acetyl-CoA synthetase n=1 Tax=Streptomyces sp. NPDC048420 TaxID=3155755 RepID=UPI00343A5E58
MVPTPFPSVPPTAASCLSGHVEVTVSPSDAVVQRLCLRPGAVVSLVLAPRADDRRWTAVRSSAPVFVLVSDWRVDADGTARASLRGAGTRGGTAEVTALAKAPDVAGAARVAFTLHVDVVPYPTQG